MNNPRAIPLIRIGRSEEVERYQVIDKAARSRYAAFPALEFAARGPAIAAGRFGAGEVWVAELDDGIVGFVLLQSHGDTVYLANISVIPEVSRRGIGACMLAHTIVRAKAIGAEAVTLTTFRAPPWNGPWFRRQGFEPMPENLIGPMLRAIIDRHSQFVDMGIRETLWHAT